MIYFMHFCSSSSTPCYLSYNLEGKPLAKCLLTSWVFLMSTVPPSHSSGTALANAIGQLLIPKRWSVHTLECITGFVDYIYISSIRETMRLRTLESSLISVLTTLAHPMMFRTYLLKYNKLVGLIGIADDLIL
jgi:hypothetical protein